jgi:hypothetical protein
MEYEVDTARNLEAVAIPVTVGACDQPISGGNCGVGFTRRLQCRQFPSVFIEGLTY